MFEQCLYFNSNALARTVSRVWAQAYSQYGLSPPHAFLIRVVLASPGLFPRDLARELGLSRSTVTRFLDSLEQRDYVTRRPSETDGRELRIYPTAKARAIRKELDATGAELSRLMGETLGRNEVLTVVAKLRKIRESLEG